MPKPAAQHAVPWLSILIPVYNVEDYLQECVKSVLSQKKDGIEIVLVEDCSTDGSLEICEAFVAAHPKIIRLARTAKNSGLSTARNTLLENARGTYIWWIDSDDFALPGSLDAIKAVVTEHGPDLIITDYLRNNTTHKKSFVGVGGALAHDKDALISGIFKSRKMYCWQKIMRRDLWDSSLRFPDGKMFEDIMTIPRVLAEVSSYYYLPQPCLSYRIRADSLMGSIARTKGEFDVVKHRDLTVAMQSLKAVVATELRPLKPSTEFDIAHFIAREFVKMAKRFSASDQSARDEFETFKGALNDSSPIAFRSLLGLYLRKGKLPSFYNLMRALRA